MGRGDFPALALSARPAVETEGLGTRAPQAVGPTSAPAGGDLLGQRVKYPCLPAIVPGAEAMALSKIDIALALMEPLVWWRT